MSTLLDWRYVGKKDRRAREAFVCAEPAKPVYVEGQGLRHPRQWEIDVQRYLRSNVPRANESMLAGWDTQGIGALGAWRDVAPGVVQIQALAVDVRFRHRGGAWAREALSRVMTRAEGLARAKQCPSLDVSALIDRRNTPSQKLCEAAGFGNLGPWEQDPALDLWGCSRDL